MLKSPGDLVVRMGMLRSCIPLNNQGLDFQLFEPAIHEKSIFTSFTIELE